MADKLFTQRDAWKGGYYDTRFVFERGTSVVAILERIWSFSELEGPFSSRDVEPEEQSVAAIVGNETLYGALRLPGGARVACASFCFELDDASDIELSISIGSLARVWPEVGGFPFNPYPDTSAWEPRLETRLLELARHVHGRMPFLRGVIAVEGAGDDVRLPGPIPAERRFGIIDVVGADLRFWPPTDRRN